MCLGQDLKQFPFWNNFIVVFCEEFAVVVNPFPSSYHLLFHFVDCFSLGRARWVKEGWGRKEVLGRTRDG